MIAYTPTPQALTIAQIILNGDPTITTAYGIKTEQGIAYLIDNGMRVLFIPQLVEAIHALLQRPDADAMQQAIAALQAVEGE